MRYLHFDRLLRLLKQCVDRFIEFLLCSQRALVLVLYAERLAPVDAYGEVDPARVIDLPKAAFEVNGEIREDLLVPGNTIPMMNSMGGVIPGVVVEVTADSVKMDLNHQMAGKTLHFKGEVVSVREATEKELTEGLHGEYVHTCGGCGGGCHGGGCGDGECGGCGEGEGDCGCGCH